MSAPRDGHIQLCQNCSNPSIKSTGTLLERKADSQVIVLLQVVGINERFWSGRRCAKAGALPGCAPPDASIIAISALAARMAAAKPSSADDRYNGKFMSGSYTPRLLCTQPGWIFVEELRRDLHPRIPTRMHT